MYVCMYGWMDGCTYVRTYVCMYSNQLAVRIFQKNTSAVRIFQNAKQFELEYSETLAVRIFQNHMNSFDAHKHFFPLCCCASMSMHCTFECQCWIFLSI